MKRIVLFAIIVFLSQKSYCQSAWEFFTMGSDKADQNNYKGAIIDYGKAIELDSKLYLAFFYRGWAKNQLKDYRGAIPDFTRCIELLDPSEKDLLAEVYNSRGTAKSDIKDYLGAITDFTKAIQYNKLPGTYYNRGLAKISNKQKESGCLDLSKAGELGYPDAYEAIQDLCN